MSKSVKAQQLRPSPRLVTSKDEAFCKYSHRDCMQNCVDGHDYCLRHILEEKAAPFRQCSYITRSGRKCPYAAPKQDKKDGLCSEHARKALIARQRAARKRRPRDSADTLLDDLVVNCNSLEIPHQNEHRRGKVHSDSIASRALDYASSSDSETEALLVDHVWRDNYDSDAESIDSDQEDLLKYAGAYTTEEVAQILRDKLIRLQALYIDQFKRLKHILLAKKRKYLAAKRAEKDLYGSMKLYKNDPHQREKYKRLCAIKHYHKKYSKEALLQRQSNQRRMQLTDAKNYKPQVFPKCVFVDEGIRCNGRVVPLSKFCQRHILHDQNQVLYRPCPFADSQCGRPVPTLLGSQFCSLHQPLPLVDLETETEKDKEDEDVQMQDDIKLADLGQLDDVDLTLNQCMAQDKDGTQATGASHEEMEIKQEETGHHHQEEMKQQEELKEVKQEEETGDVVASSNSNLCSVEEDMDDDQMR